MSPIVSGRNNAGHQYLTTGKKDASHKKIQSSDIKITRPSI
jgi:hypothetical protein